MGVHLLFQAQRRY